MLKKLLAVSAFLSLFGAGEGGAQAPPGPGAVPAERPSGISALLREARALYEQGDLPGAIGTYERALDLADATGQAAASAEALEGLGAAHRAEGNPRKAIELVSRSREVRRAIHDRAGEAASLNAIGRAYVDLGEIEAARGSLGEGLALARAVADRSLEADLQIALGQLDLDTGEAGQALDRIGTALSSYREAGDRFGESQALILHSRALSYLGETDRATAGLGEALKIARELKDAFGESVVLGDLGRLEVRAGRLGEAARTFEASLDLVRASGDKFGEMQNLVRLGEIQGALGDSEGALAKLRQALAMQRTAGNPRGEADVLRALCRVAAEMGLLDEALASCRRAIEIAHVAADRRLMVQALHTLARALVRRGDLEGASSAIERALTEVESLRGRVGPPRLRTVFFASNEDLYDLSIDLLLRLDRVAAAFETAERSRARELLDILGEARAGIRAGVDPALLEREATLARRLNDRERYRARLAGARPVPPELAAVSAEVDRLLADLEETDLRIRVASPAYAALTQPRPASLATIQKELLRDGTVLLEYALGEERSHVWRVTAEAIDVFVLPARAKIEEAAGRLVAGLAARGERRRFETPAERTRRIAEADRGVPRAASDLARMILPPLAGRLEGSRLLIVAQGALQKVPFAVLPDPAGRRGPLLDRHEIVYCPSASALLSIRGDTARRPAAPRQVAVFADPVFSVADPRVAAAGPPTAAAAAVAGANPGASAPSAGREVVAHLDRAVEDTGLVEAGAPIPRLPFTRAEALDLLAASRRPDDLSALDFSASVETVRGQDLGRYRIVHFATHALLDDRHPELSGIVLSLVDSDGAPRDGFLRLHDIYNLRLGADLVVLSACRSAIGPERRGEGLLGLARGFFYAGAPRVLASLWNTHDEGTAELMKRFYSAHLRRGLPPAAALRQAQLAMSREPRFRSPFYWADMILEGDWR